MILLDSKLRSLEYKQANGEKLKIAIFGLGSVGNYLLTFLLSQFDNIEIYVVGRSTDKMLSDVNINKVAISICHNRNIEIKIIEADFTNIDQLATILLSIRPDFLVNSSRAYSHIKYGSISWNNIRAYGIWTPLSVKYIKNIMEGVRQSNVSPIVINTSYSDATNAWLKTGGNPYPDFGSGNLNHLIPRIKFAVGNIYGISDINNIDVTLCTSHFHDVLISKEGITEGIEPLINVKYQGKQLKIDAKIIYARCTIKMPSDEKRNMMNASSNFEIIFKVINSIKFHTISKFHSPGFCGMIGGYPVEVDFTSDANNKVRVVTDFFSLEQMHETNRSSIYLDGIESIQNGNLIFTDEILAKSKKAFKYELPKSVNLQDSDIIANEIITNIIDKFVK
jgi:hypothetical protein